MSLPLLVRSKLCWHYHGVPDVCWYLGYANYSSIDRQNAYIDDMDRFDADTATLNILNEHLCSPFIGEFMASPMHQGRLKMLGDFIVRLKDRGKKVAIVYVDCPPADDAVYPFWRYADRLAQFIEIATPPLAQLADAFILGIETNRGPLSVELVEYGIDLIRKHAFRMVDGYKLVLPVGNHEQNVGYDSKGRLRMTRRAPRNADFIGFETSNHPYWGYEVPVSKMRDEVAFLVAHSNATPVWVMESNNLEDAHARKQNRAMAALPGVIGVSGPL